MYSEIYIVLVVLQHWLNLVLDQGFQGRPEWFQHHLQKYSYRTTFKFFINFFPPLVVTLTLYQKGDDNTRRSILLLTEPRGILKLDGKLIFDIATDWPFIRPDFMSCLKTFHPFYTLNEIFFFLFYFILVGILRELYK